jgi:antibiotic biosynthesis monooxygenase (ABM) superfamily enzyme
VALVIQRRTLLEQGERFNLGLAVRQASHGFNFWFENTQAAGGGPLFTFKSNLLVLLVLYPVVFLWSYFVGRRLVDVYGVSFWLALFVGNVVSTQLLGWWVAPAAFKLFDWWLGPKLGAAKQVAGYLLLVVLYAISMGIYAFLLMSTTS